MLDAITRPEIVFFGILLVAFIILVTERIRNDLVAVLIILSLAATGLLSPKAVAGFASEPALVVASVFVLSAALHSTGVSETIGHWVGRLAGGGYARAVGVMMSAVALLSAFTHHGTSSCTRRRSRC